MQLHKIKTLQTFNSHEAKRSKLSAIFKFSTLSYSSSTIFGKKLEAKKTIYTNSNCMVMGACKIIYNDANT